MLAAVALLVLMMAVIVQVFAAATGAVSAARSYQELDAAPRQADTTIRQDLQNVTARFTPPLNPKDNLGYFEYAENSFADNQGEDGDDTLRFTVKAPEGQVFTGRVWVPAATGALNQQQYQYYVRTQPITVTSRYAEVIYFLRNGNLYRRVLLVAPEYTNTPLLGSAPPASPGALGGDPYLLVSWQGVNDLSAHPAGSGQPQIVLNTLGDLTNRENRFASPRFSNDRIRIDYPPLPLRQYPPVDYDLLPDDSNSDSVPDFWPSLYWNVWNAGGRGSLTPLMNEPPPASGFSMRLGATSIEAMPFPYLYPGAYSLPHQASAGFGWIFSPDPSNDQATIAHLNALNHNPIAIGDSLPFPSAKVTWWGFPTWRETMSFQWTDPYSDFRALGQSNGLHPLDPSVTTAIFNTNKTVARDPLPSMTTATFGASATPYRPTDEPNNDGVGSSLFATNPSHLPKIGPDSIWRRCWEDDLLMTGVRSFDVKAYDNSCAGYVDLGWGDDGRLYVPYLTAAQVKSWSPPLLAGHRNYLSPGTSNGFPLLFTWPPVGGSAFGLVTQTYAHEGRIPPLVNDFRLDPQATSEASSAADPSYNLGDDNKTVIRLRRVWDSWSTDYSNAPATGVNPATGLAIGPPFSRPVYPSYPAPYPMALRGVQIQIRVVDPRSQYVKTLTIRQDFSDKL
jgi:hypothetical protein